MTISVDLSDLWPTVDECMDNHDQKPHSCHLPIVEKR